MTLLKKLVFFVCLLIGISHIASGAEKNNIKLNQSAQAALNQLLKTNPTASNLNSKAVSVLVFPNITKAGVMIGGHYGDGVLLTKGKPSAYYNTTGVSYGMQIGAQEYGYALFFMTKNSITALDSTQGFEIGVGPSIVVVDDGFAKSSTSINLQNDIYAFIFNQKGLMAGVGIQGNKITKLDK
jgi:lipid-binding SYLF domain-containing protein